MARRRPYVAVTPPADAYSGPRERIIEFADSRGFGGLIAFRERDDGTLLVSVYRCDPQVVVAHGGQS